MMQVIIQPIAENEGELPGWKLVGVGHGDLRKFTEGEQLLQAVADIKAGVPIDVVIARKY